MRFVRSTPPPLLTALSCLETPLERQAVVNEQVVDQSPRRLHCCVFSSAPPGLRTHTHTHTYNSDFLFSAKCELGAFPIQYTLTLASCRKSHLEQFLLRRASLIGGFSSISIAKECKLEF